MALGVSSSGNMQRSKYDSACKTKNQEKKETMLPFNTEPALEGDYILLRFSSLLPQISCCKRNTSQYNNSSIKENQSLLMPSLIPGDSSAILPVIIPTANFRGWASPTQPLLDMVGIEEVECLTPSSGGPAAGQCQFACISTALSDSLTSLDNNSRLDLELRRLALRIIETNPTMYQDFLTTAGCRTRSKSLHGGRSVDIKAYIAAMSNPACDGDAVTLQALCDALKITVRVTKLVEAQKYDEASQTERLLASSRSSSDFFHSIIEARDTSSLILDEDSCSFGSSDTCSSYASAMSRDSVENLEMRVSPTLSAQEKGARKRLYISHDIEPRCLGNVDSEIRRFASSSQGRLIWLSHVGDEAHYRLLRLKSAFDTMESSVFNRHEEIMASESRIQRILKLQASDQLVDLDFVEAIPMARSQTHVNIGVHRAQLGNRQCTLCLKSLFDDPVEIRGYFYFCNVQCCATWSKLRARKTPATTQQPVINLVDDTQASIKRKDEASSFQADAKPKDTSLTNDKSCTKHSPHRSEIFSRLRPRPSRPCSLTKTRHNLRKHKRLIRPVDR